MQPCWTQDRSNESTAAGYLAVSTVRRSFHDTASCAPAPRVAPMLVKDLQAVADLFRVAQDRMINLQGAGLRVAPPGATALTRHERRLIRATNAAQSGDDKLVDNYLFKLAPHRKVRPSLAHAVTMLGMSLAAAGHWLSPLPLPGAALSVARLRGLDLDLLAIEWPLTGGGAYVRL